MKTNDFEIYVNRRFDDLLTYILEITEREIVKSELKLCTMTEDEYDNCGTLSFIRKCELVWILSQYISERGDDRRMPIDKIQQFKTKVYGKFSPSYDIKQSVVSDKTESIINRRKDNDDPMYWWDV